MQLPPRVGVAEGVEAVEAIGDVDAQRTERADGRGAEAGAAEETRGIEVARTIPEVAGVVERREVQRLVDGQADLGRRGEERAAEGFELGVERARRRAEAARRDRELRIAAQRLAELHAAQ